MSPLLEFSSDLEGDARLGQLNLCAERLLGLSNMLTRVGPWRQMSENQFLDRCSSSRFSRLTRAGMWDSLTLHGAQKAGLTDGKVDARTELTNTPPRTRVGRERKRRISHINPTSQRLDRMISEAETPALITDAESGIRPDNGPSNRIAMGGMADMDRVIHAARLGGSVDSDLLNRTEKHQDVPKYGQLHPVIRMTVRQNNRREFRRVDQLLQRADEFPDHQSSRTVARSLRSRKPVHGLSGDA